MLTLRTPSRKHLLEKQRLNISTTLNFLLILWWPEMLNTVKEEFLKPSLTHLVKTLPQGWFGKRWKWWIGKINHMPSLRIRTWSIMFEANLDKIPPESVFRKRSKHKYCWWKYCIDHWAKDEDDDGRYGSLQNRWGRAGTCISSGWEVLATGRMKAILGNNDHHYYDDGDDDEDHPHHYHHHQVDTNWFCLGERFNVSQWLAYIILIVVF